MAAPPDRPARKPPKPRRRSWLALALALCCGVAAAAPSCERPSLEAVSDLGLGSYQEQGQIKGLIPDLMQQLQALSGCALQLAFMPRARALVEIDRGEVDIITSMLRTPERDRLGACLPDGYTKHDLIVVPESATGIASFADLIRSPDLTLGIVRGIRTNSRVDAQIEQLLVFRRAEFSSDYNSLSPELAARRVLAVMMPNALHLKLRRDGLLPGDVAIVNCPRRGPSSWAST